MKKRLWSAILAMCIVLSMTPTAAFAADDTEDTTKTEVETTAVQSEPEDNGESGLQEEPAEIAEEIEITSEGGNLSSGSYILNSNIALDTDLTIPEDSVVTIDLNGHTLTGTGESSVITVYGNLTLKDSTAADVEDSTASTPGVHFNGVLQTKVNSQNEKSPAKFARLKKGIAKQTGAKSPAADRYKLT